MKIRLKRDVLAEAVQWAARNLPSRTTEPILAGILMHADADGVILSAFDSDTSARITVPAEVTDEGTALVSGRLLAEISRSLPDHPVDITADDAKMELLCGPARFTLQTMPVEDYPPLPAMPESTGAIGSQDFARAVSQVVVAASRDEMLAVFTGVRVEIDGETVSLLATDRYRMALKEITWNPAQPSVSAAALIPAKVLAETAKSMTSGEQVTLSLSQPGVGEGLAGFDGSGPGGEREITTRLLDGDFPKVRHLMDIKPTLSVRGRTRDIIDAAKRVALVADRNTPLRMSVTDGGITLEAATGEQARASEALEAVVDLHGADEPTIAAAGFNPTYLLDALNALDTEFVHFSFTQPGKPCLLTGLESLDGEQLLDYRHVIMLMRLPN